MRKIPEYQQAKTLRIIYQEELKRNQGDLTILRKVTMNTSIYLEKKKQTIVILSIIKC